MQIQFILKELMTAMDTIAGLEDNRENHGDELLTVTDPFTSNVLGEKNEVSDSSNVDDWQEVKRKSGHRTKKDLKKKGELMPQHRKV